MKYRSSRPRVSLLIAAIAVASVLALPTAAAAHDSIVSSDPEAGSTVTTELDSVSLVFSDELLDLGDANGAFAIQVVGPDDRYYNLDCVDREGDAASTAVALGESGRYEVTWQVVSSDGHPTSDSFDFTYEKPTDVDAATGAETPPCGSSGGDASGDKEAKPGESGNADSATALWVAGGVVGALLIAVAIAVAVLAVRRRRLQATGDNDPDGRLD